MKNLNTFIAVFALICCVSQTGCIEEDLDIRQTETGGGAASQGNGGHSAPGFNDSTEEGVYEPPNQGHSDGAFPGDSDDDGFDEEAPASLWPSSSPR